VPPARYGHSATLVGSKVLVYGGVAWPNLYNDMFHYDVYDNTWATVPGTPPYARKQHSMDAFVDMTDNRTKIVVFGGKHGSGGYSSHLHFFDVESSKWTHGAIEGPQPPAIGNHASAVKDNESLIIFGGYNGTHSSNDVYSVDLPIGTWEKLDADGDLPPPCHGHTVVKASGEWLQFGGVDCLGDNCTFFNELHSLATETLSWTRVEVNGSIPRPRASHTMTAISDSAHLMFGGVGAYFSNMNDLYAYSHESKAWAFVDAIGAKPEARFGHAAQAHGGKLLVFGGANCKSIGDCTFFNDLHMFIPATRVWIKLSIQGHYPSGRSGVASLMLGERLFIHGGGAKDKIFSEMITVEPDRTIPESTVVLGPGVTHGDAGTATRFFVQLQDSFGVNRTTGGDHVTVKVGPTTHQAIMRLGKHHIHMTVKDENNGQYSVDFTSKITDVYNVTVTVNGVVAKQFQTAIRANHPNGSTSFAKGSGLTHCIAGEECEATVEVFDSYSNLVDHKISVDSQFTGPRHVLKKIKDAGNGKHRLTYTPEKAGNYTVILFVAGQPIAGSPFNLTVVHSAASPRRSRIIGDGLAGARAGQLGTARLVLFDGFDNSVMTSSDVVKGQLLGPDELACAIQNHGNGTFSLSYTAIKVGLYRLNVVLNDQPVEGSPFPVRITNAPVASATSFAYGSGMRYAIAGYRAYFTIQAADDFCNNMTTGGAQFNVLFAGPGDSKQISNVTDHGDGMYTVSYQTNVAGDFMVSATLWNSELGYQSIHLSPFLGFTVAAGADPAKSFMYLDDKDKPLSTSQVPFRAVMGVHNYFHIQAVDRYGNRKTTGGDHFTAELEGPSSASSFISDKGDGTYVGTYVAPASGRFWLKVFYGNIALSGTPIAVVVRTNFDVCPNGCSGQGICRDNTCVCNLGYAGLDCSVQTGNCPRNCMGNGACLNNTCFCYPGFTGPSCGDSTTLCPNDCSKHGECVDAACVCDEGYRGLDCSNNTATCPDRCSGNGECVDGQCLCYPGFQDANCLKKGKFCPKGCSGRGRCMTSGMCACHDGWTGLDCHDQLRDGVLSSASNLAQRNIALQPSDLPSRLPRK